MAESQHWSFSDQFACSERRIPFTDKVYEAFFPIGFLLGRERLGLNRDQLQGNSDIDPGESFSTPTAEAAVKI